MTPCKHICVICDIEFLSSRTHSLTCSQRCRFIKFKIDKELKALQESYNNPHIEIKSGKEFEDDIIKKVVEEAYLIQ